MIKVKNNPVKISLVTTSKGRLDYLKESIITWLKIDYINFDIIIVDYDCPDKTEAYIKKNKEKLIKNSKALNIYTIKVKNKPIFNLCDARNIGIDFADSELILMIDADVHIKDKNILNIVSEQYKKGCMFFSNVTILSTNFIEGNAFYKVKYGIKRIKYHSLLPTHCKIVGLSGTACFVKKYYTLCGKYRVEVNESGWGSHDLEFYLRYLNYLFINKYKELNLTLLKIQTFSNTSFDLIENTILEKTKFYRKKKNVSTSINRNYIVDLLTKTGEKYGWIKRGNQSLIKPVSIFKYKRYEKYSIPQWFKGWHNFRTGKFFYSNGDNVSALKYFLNVTNDKKADILLRMQSYLFIAFIKKKEDNNRWKYYLKKGMKIFKNKKIDKNLMIFVEKYNTASFLKCFKYYIEGKEMFLHLINNKNKIDEDILVGAYFHLGELEYWNKNYKKSNDYFNNVLKLNSNHRRANEYIKRISKK